MTEYLNCIVRSDDLPCYKCKHYMEGRTCESFPNGIPGDVYDARNAYTVKEPLENSSAQTPADSSDKEQDTEPSPSDNFGTDLQNRFN